MLKQLGYGLVFCVIFMNSSFATSHKDTKNEEMAKWAEHTTPNENHSLLKDLVGNWKVQSKWWMNANAKRMEVHR